MRFPVLFCSIPLLWGCASSPVGKPCDIDAAGRQKPMENIAIALKEKPEIRADQYIKEPFEPSAIYNGKDYCTFIIRPWQPIQSVLIWDGALGFRINKQSQEVEDISRIDE